MSWPKACNAVKPHDFDLMHAASDYQPPLSNWISALKFNSQLHHVQSLAKLFVMSLVGRTLPMPQAIVPAPLSTSKHLERHYNQARLLAQSIAYKLDISVIDQVLTKIKNTKPQTELNRKQRLLNPVHAYKAITLSPSFEHVAIFDDVITTGASMNAMVETLKKANPNLKIEVWSIAISLSSLNKVG
jgi:ComF family protein